MARIIVLPRCPTTESDEVTRSTVPANDFRKVSFASPEKADRRWLDWYREEYARLLSRLEFEVDDENELRVQTTVRALPGVAICYGGVSPMRIAYDPHRAVDDDILLILPPEQGMSIELRNSHIMLDRYGGAIAANDVPNVVTFGPASNFMTVLLNRRSLAPLVPHPFDVVGKSIPAELAAFATFPQLRQIARRGGGDRDAGGDGTWRRRICAISPRSPSAQPVTGQWRRKAVRARQGSPR